MRIIDVLNSKIIFSVSGWLLKTLYDRFWRLQPKVQCSIEILKKGYSSDFQNPSVEFEIVLTLDNASNNVALNVNMEVLESSSFNNLNNDFLARTLKQSLHLKALDKFCLKIPISINIPTNDFHDFENNGEVIFVKGLKHKDPLTYFRPSQFDNIKLILSYQNEKHQKFYTKLRFSKNSKILAYGIFKPFLLDRLLKV